MRHRAIKTLLLRTFLPTVVVVAILIAGFVYNRLYASILDGFERKLVAASVLTGAMIDPADHDRLIRAARAGENPQAVEATPLYRRSVAPIERIREALGLTYLYTQVLGGSADIFYVLDGTQGDDHSPIGSEDDLTDVTRVGLRRVQSSGAIYVSPIEYQEQWGLLKTAAAPVFGDDGSITGSAGADVDISVIQVATQNALFMSAMIGIGSILTCILVALALVRRIAGPIEALTGDMLKIAGGGPPALAPVSGPREVRELGAVLDRRVQAAAGEAQHRADSEARHEMGVRGAMLAAQTGRDATEPVILVAKDRMMVIWIARPHFDPETVLAHCAMSRLAEAFAENPALSVHWRDLVDGTCGTCLVVDGTAGKAESVGAGRLEVSVRGRRYDVDPGAPFRFDPQESLYLVGADGRAFPCWPGNAR